MPPPPQPPIFLPAKGNQYGPVFPYGTGHLFSCQYQFFKHDPKPLVLMTRRYLDGRVAGINLHYLTFPYVRWLIHHYCGNPSFSYLAIKPDKYIVNAFRSYKFVGLRMVRGIDCYFLKTVLESLRSLDPEEIEAMRKEVNRQLRQRMNMKAEDYSREHRDKAREFVRGVYPQPYEQYAELGPPPLRDTRSPFAEPGLEAPPGRGPMPPIPPIPGVGP